MTLRGRPPIGPVFELRLDKKMLDEIESQARIVGVSRNEVIRSYIRDGLNRANNNRRRSNA